MIRHKLTSAILWLILTLIHPGCVPFDKIYSHDFNSGYFDLKSPEQTRRLVYVDLYEDSATVYLAIRANGHPEPGKIPSGGFETDGEEPAGYFENCTFIKTSLDLDLSTAVLKYRPAVADVPPQLNANVNGMLYAGFRRDFFKIKSRTDPLKKSRSFIRHTGFDFGLFSGLGITMINPTVTGNNITQEYDGIVFQKGFSVFGTYENLSVGLALGFDNLLDHNKSHWLYNRKPWIGIILGVANF